MRVVNVMVISILVNLFLVIIKLIGGIFGHSHALIADGIHSFSDLITDFIAIIGAFFARKPPDNKHPFGHANIEYVTGFAISFFILGIGYSIIKHAFTNTTLIPSTLVIVISLITIFFKLLLSRFVLYYGHKSHNQILIASGKESNTDVISSIVVLISALFMQLASYYPIFRFADKCAAIVVGIFILKIGIDIFKDNLSFIIGEQETDIDYINQIYTLILSVPNVCSISNFILLKYGSYYKLTGCIGMRGSLTLDEAHSIIDEVEVLIASFDKRIRYITIHMEPEKEVT